MGAEKTALSDESGPRWGRSVALDPQAAQEAIYRVLCERRDWETARFAGWSQEGINPQICNGSALCLRACPGAPAKLHAMYHTLPVLWVI